MRTETVDDRVERYLAGVREELADLRDGDREELLEDLRDHLTEVAAEDDSPLEERLGPAARYAEELRASAGLPSGARGRRRLPRLTETAPVRAVVASPVYGAVRDFLPELRPGWWVLRGYLAVVAVDAAFGTATTRGGLPLPSLYGSRLIGLLAVAAAIWASVSLGRRTAGSGRARRTIIVADVAIVIVSLAALSSGPSIIYEVAEGQHPFDGYLAHPDGEPIANICPYSGSGEPLEDVLLFDGGGRPITNIAPLYETEHAAAGVPNAYPKEGFTWDAETGERVRRACPRVIVAEPAPVVTAGPSPSPVATPAPTPPATPED